jgi:hypothetical protein
MYYIIEMDVCLPAPQSPEIYICGIALALLRSVNKRAYVAEIPNYSGSYPLNTKQIFEIFYSQILRIPECLYSSDENEI